MLTQEKIESIVRKIVEHFNPAKIVVFGSYATGEPDDESDLDLYIEMETDLRPPERGIEVSSIFGLHDWPMDCLVCTPEEARRMRGRPGSLVSVIEEEGKIVYDGTRSRPFRLAGKGRQGHTESA